MHFAKNLPFLTWQTSDLFINHQGINLWIDESPAPNLKRPITFDLNDVGNLLANIDTIFTANTLHIVSWPLVLQFFNMVEKQLLNDGILCIYGPFTYQGKFTSQSNENFDNWLKARDEKSGIRDFEAICQLASESGLTLTEDVTMPANNRLLVFQKR